MITRTLLAVVLVGASVRAADLAADVDGYLEGLDTDVPVKAADPGKPGGPWRIVADLGVTMTDGNSESVTATFGVEAERAWDVWKLLLNWNSIYAESEDVESANEHIFTERLDRELSEISSVFQELRAEHDEQERLRIRLQLSLGYARQLKKTENFELRGEVGAGVLYEEFRNPDTDDTSGELILRLRWTWEITEQLTYKSVLTVYPSLSDGGEFRAEWVNKFSTPVSDRTKLSLSIIDRYDSDPPAGIEGNDILVTLSLTIDFSKQKKAEG